MASGGNTYESIRRGKLTFKGQSSAAGKAAPASGSGPRPASVAGIKRKAEPAAPQEGWVRVTEFADFAGPVFVCIGGNSKCLSVSESGELRLEPTPASQEPEEVCMPRRVVETMQKRYAVMNIDCGGCVETSPASDQVFVAHSINPGVVVLKTAYGKYLSADKFGIVTATTEAVGALQEWTPILRDDGVAFQSKYEKFLKFEDERNSVRADSESIGYCEVFSVRCQAARRAEARRQAQQKSAATKSVTEQEMEAAKRYQSWGLGRVKLASDDTDLGAAAREGQLAGALLERRMKVKSDKYCK